MRAPSGENAALSTAPSCPRRLSRSAPGGVSPGQRGRGRQSGSSRAAFAQGRLVSPSRPNNLVGEFAPVLHQRWKGKPDRPPDPPHVGVGAFGEIAAVKRTCIGRVQPRLDPCVVREQVVRRSILVSAPQMQDQEPPAVGLVERKRVPHPAAFGAYGPNHCGMCCLQPFGAKPVAQIPQHVVVQPQRAPAEVERLQQRQPAQPHDEVVGVVLVEPAGLRPERLDDSKRHVFVLRQHGQLGESRRLVHSEVLDAGLDAEANRLVALGFVPRVEHEWPVAGETSLESGDRVGERFTPRHPLTQPAIRDGQHLRPEAKTFRQGGEPERGRGLVRARQMGAHHAGCLRRPHLVDRDRHAPGGEDAGQPRRDQPDAVRSAAQERLELRLAPDIVDHQQDAGLTEEFAQVLGCGDDVGKSGASAVRIELFDQVRNEAGDIVALLADLDPQDAVGELEANIVVAAQGVGERRLAIAAGAEQRGGERHCSVRRLSEHRRLQWLVLLGPGDEIGGKVALHVGCALGASVAA